jgi:amino acid permease
MKSYKFYRNFAIICGVLFFIATVIFVVGIVKFLYLNPYNSTADSLRLFLSATLIFQFYMVYLILGCYRKWERSARYRAYEHIRNRRRRKDAEFSEFINNHLNY